MGSDGFSDSTISLSAGKINTQLDKATTICSTIKRLSWDLGAALVPIKQLCNWLRQALVSETSQPSGDNALLQAIRDPNFDSVGKHLSTGLNDVPLRTLSHNAASYLRFGPVLELGDEPLALSAPYYQREDVLLAINRLQLTRISDDEVEDRLYDCIPRFWTGIDFPSRCVFVIPYGDRIPAFIEAAQGDSLAIVDLLCQARAEVSFSKTESLGIPLGATPSSLALSTLLHAAIWSRRKDSTFSASDPLFYVKAVDQVYSLMRMNDL